MRRITFLGDSSRLGARRFRNLEIALARNVAIRCVNVPTHASNFCSPHKVDILVADQHGLEQTPPQLIRRLIEASPDVIVVVIADAFDQASSNVTIQHGAVDCLCWTSGYDQLAASVQGLLAQLTLAQSAITSMNCVIEEFDVTLAIDSSKDNIGRVAKYALRNFAQMDVCGLRNQIRAMRVLKEILQTLRREILEGETEPKKFTPGGYGLLPYVAEATTNRVRVHISKAGLRIALRFDKLSDSERISVLEFANRGLWFAPLFMDEIEFVGTGNELSMLMLPDDVCTNVAKAIADRRSDAGTHDVLGHVLNIIDKRDRS